ncbi:ATP-dependent DNA ligase LigD phosphoesterase module /ATP-dependent DNA ligase LigD polymerase module [Variovorax sp. HW608]|uniref:DNA ligase D n=1 Tax=Variovorax sp. HW608 TaxID=1034889 RepID=UPI00081FF164|nr:DNA ligase D [Variovorax sp. HW608]SCK61420.1 ATP-dependent DNA ligase LigD phosphoesterase module /ATP-dependent DNA ligase LigD polymerase module [Variovorax sp. HW608]
MGKQVETEALAPYRRKRDFRKTPEPHSGGSARRGVLSFVVQKHHASRLHYDFRLELDGTLKSWAVPKGPCLDPTVKRMAVHVEDHPISYADFEGTIPPRQYGAGTVIVWDRGDWVPEGDARKALAEGKLKFELRGKKLRGHWTLVRMHGKAGEKQEPWLLIKERDRQARPIDEYDVVEAEPDSVLTGRDVDSPPPVTYQRQPDPPADEAAPARKAAAKPAEPPGRKADLPATLSPELATLATAPPAREGDWLYELKFDGYRLLTRIDEKGKVQCITRNGHDWTSKLPALAKALAKLPLRSTWLDGEIVVDDEHGAPDFQALQNAFDRGSTSSIVYWLFDLPFLDGRDLRSVPVEERRDLLATVLASEPQPLLRFSEAFEASPRDLLASSARIGFEGIIGKRRGSGYVSRRSPDWIKLKNQRRQEFVIGGYTAPQGSRAGFGSLLLGVYDDAGALQYCGNVGTGFDAGRLSDIKARLDKVQSEECPFAKRPAGVKAQWVTPVLVCEVSFGEWTDDDRIRHPVFQGLRSDKPARQIRRETAFAPETEPAAPAREGTPAVPKQRVTHADRVIDKDSGVTKGELVAYYEQVAELILPHLKGRPVALVRAPEGIGGELFFQKHARKTELPGVKLLDPSLDRDHEPLLQIDSVRGLLSAAQMNVIELHTWNATSNAIDKPDRMTFDLDPGEGVQWAQMQEAALLVHTILTELGLVTFLKTSGGKGLHVMVPIRRQYDWDTVKGFSQAVVQHLARIIPDRFVAKSGPRNRVGKIFVDYLRNGLGATTVAAWSARSRPGLGVSVPVAWDELPGLSSASQWNVRNIGRRLPAGNTPWDDMAKSAKALGPAMKRLGYAP